MLRHLRLPSPWLATSFLLLSQPYLLKPSSCLSAPNEIIVFCLSTGGTDLVSLSGILHDTRYRGVKVGTFPGPYHVCIGSFYRESDKSLGTGFNAIHVMPSPGIPR